MRSIEKSDLHTAKNTEKKTAKDLINFNVNIVIEILKNAVKERVNIMLKTAKKCVQDSVKIT